MITLKVANQQGIYLAAALNGDKLLGPQKPEPFKYQHLGSMASVGDWKGVYDSTNIGTHHHPPVCPILLCNDRVYVGPLSFQCRPVKAA